MSKKTEKEAVNRVNLRITDKTVLDLIEDLTASPIFKSKTEILNLALSKGTKELYQETFGKKKQTDTQTETPANVGADGADIKSVRISLDQTAVTLNMCEKLLTVLYNLEAAKADGVELNPELFTSGVLDQLPAHLEAEKQAMMKAEFMKRSLRKRALYFYYNGQCRQRRRFYSLS
ncbi:MAG: hypothetical protein LBP79_01910 [Clostridiales bacterium]|jgi:hypothetical protein|nr:hypothetical protein [Clostridiales bacterium]